MEHEDFVTFDQAMKLKDLGFDWKCNNYYEGNGDHPTLHESTQFYMSARSPYVSEFYHNFNDLTNRHDQPVYPRCSAPTLSQVQKWFREVHGIDIDIDSVYHRLDTGNKIMYGLRIGIQKTFKKEFYLNHYSYNEALTTGINHALKLIKEEI